MKNKFQMIQTDKLLKQTNRKQNKTKRTIDSIKHSEWKGKGTFMTSERDICS